MIAQRSERPRQAEGPSGEAVASEDTARPATRHAHCEECLESFALEDLGEFALLSVTRYRTRILDASCAAALRRAGEIVDCIGSVAR